MVKECSHGKCLVATMDLPGGTAVEKFEGVVIKHEPGLPGIPDDEIRYFLIVDDETAIIPKTNARYINHACEPNCDFNDDMEVVTMRDVKEGEELVFSYNEMYKDDKPGTWDHRWTFKCECGSRICQGMIDKYVYRKGDRWIPIGIPRASR
jgi:hypothetical protein